MKKVITFSIIPVVLLIILQACAPSRPIANIDSYRLSDISYRIDDQQVTQFVYAARNKSVLKRGQLYNENKMARERERLARLIQESGIKDFDKKAITFLVDSTVVVAQKQFSVVTVIDTH